MNLDAMLAEHRRDSTHEFKGGADTELCAFCGKRRGFHLHDGHRHTASPYPSDDELEFCHRGCYRAHPGWTKPGTLRNRKETT